VVLGRPWRPSRSFADGRYGDPQAVGAAAFIRCYMGDHISADGWDEMGYQSKSGAKVYLSPAQARFAEFGSTGPGAFENRRRPWLSPDAARAFNRQHVLGGWDPSV
jgi:pectinesterase